MAKKLPELVAEPLELHGGRLFRFDADVDAEIAPESYDALDAANDEAQARSSENFARVKNWYEKTFGGLDIEALPIPDRTSKAANQIEADFCKIFGSILQLEDVGADESFFDLGGTSLLVTRVVIMAQKLG